VSGLKGLVALTTAHWNTITTLDAITFAEIHCVSKGIPDVFSYNSQKDCRIFVIFGKNITEKPSSQKMLYFYFT